MERDDELYQYLEERFDHVGKLAEEMVARAERLARIAEEMAPQYESKLQEEYIH